MSRDKVLLFDLGGVLVQSEGLDRLKSMVPADVEHSVPEKWHSSRAVSLFERGKISPQAFAALFIEEWSLPLKEGEFLALFASWVKGFFPGAEAMLQQLRAGNRVAYLSNTNAVHFAGLPQLSTLFDCGFASHQSGHMKPSAEAYENAIAGLGVHPSSIHFFDDLEPNVVAAREVGMNAIQVRGLAEVEAVLRAEGLFGGGGT